MVREAEAGWIETVATVTTCKFQFARMNTFTLGIQTGERFRITFDYYAHGRLYSGEFQSPVAIPQNEQVPIFYNPLRPEENSRSAVLGGGGGSGRGPLLAVGFAGSVVLSLAWLAVLHGCR